MRVIMTFELPAYILADARSLLPGVLVSSSSHIMGKSPVIVGNRTVQLGDICKLKRVVSKEDAVVFEGSTEKLINCGSGMDKGTLIIDGNAGYGVGSGMRAGEIQVRGNAGDCLGMGMQGGLIRVQGNAGDRCGAGRPGEPSGMAGGTILVAGSAGSEAGAGMRQGLVCIAGCAGSFAGARMLAGTLLVCGKVGAGAGIGMRRGSLLAGRLEDVLPGFSPAGPPDEEWLRIYYSHILRMGFPLPGGWIERKARRFTGDNLELGKGELITYDLPE